MLSVLRNQRVRCMSTRSLYGPCQTAIEMKRKRLHEITTESWTNESHYEQIKRTQHILQAANVLHHAAQFQNHLAVKTKRTPDLYHALFHGSNDSKQILSFDDVAITSLNDEVLSESIIKQVTLNDKLTFRCEWRIEANRVANLGVNTWTCSLRAGQYGADLIHVIDVHDCSNASEHQLSVGTIHQWRSQLGPPFDSLNEQDFGWLLTDVLTFPSDHAFDVLSRSLMNQK